MHWSRNRTRERSDREGRTFPGLDLKLCTLTTTLKSSLTVSSIISAQNHIYSPERTKPTVLKDVSFRQGVQISVRCYCCAPHSPTHPFDSHVFGQPAKKENGIENVRLSSSAWDTNLISCSGVSCLLSPPLANFDALVAISRNKLSSWRRRRVLNSPIAWLRSVLQVVIQTPRSYTLSARTHSACSRHRLVPFR